MRIASTNKASRHARARKAGVNVLVIDIGGTHVKLSINGQGEQREFVSGPELTPGKMVSRIRKLTTDWNYDVISVGYPGLVSQNRPVAFLGGLRLWQKWRSSSNRGAARRA